jgi:NTE family protein
VEFSLQEVHIRNLAGAEGIEERYRLGIFKVGTLVDTKDSYPFPRSGVGFNLLYEFAPEALGGDIGYNALRLMWETFVSLSDHSTFHPRFTAGFADKTMPYGQQFRFGGRDSFFGLREDDRRGRQMLLANLEYRYRLPFTLFFDAYIRTRYDVGAISTIPEEIKFNTLRHGVGVELALDTPIGPAVFGAGKAFFLSRDLPDNPILWGPTLLYFLIGYQF